MGDDSDFIEGIVRETYPITSNRLTNKRFRITAIDHLLSTNYVYMGHNYHVLLDDVFQQISNTNQSLDIANRVLSGGKSISKDYLDNINIPLNNVKEKLPQLIKQTISVVEKIKSNSFNDIEVKAVLSEQFTAQFFDDRKD